MTIENENKPARRVDDIRPAAPLDWDEAASPAQAGTAPRLRLGQIAERLGFPLTADFLRTLGFEPAGRDKAAVLYSESDLQPICAALVRRITAAAPGSIEQPAHETIVCEAGGLVCTTCGTTAPAVASIGSLSDEQIEEAAVDYYRPMTDSTDGVIGFARAIERLLAHAAVRAAEPAKTINTEEFRRLAYDWAGELFGADQRRMAVTFKALISHIDARLAAPASPAQPSAALDDAVKSLFAEFEKGAAPYKVEVTLAQLEDDGVQVAIDAKYARAIFRAAGLIPGAQDAAAQSVDGGAA